MVEDEGFPNNRFSDIMEYMSDSNNPAKTPKRLVKKKKTTTTSVRPRLSLKNPELEALFDKMYAMRDDLQAKFNKVGEMLGMSSKEISVYLNNPNNFSPSQWAKMQMDKKRAEEQLYLGMGKGEKEQRAKKAIEKQAKERRGKMIGARKKWLQM